MHNSVTHRFVSAIFLGVLILVTPFSVFAASPSTIIPCGFDINGDGAVKDPSPLVWASNATTPGNHEECYFNDVIETAQNVINFLIFKIAAPLGAVMFAYAGFLYVTNRGNEGQVKQAHDVFLNVFWGLIIALAAWVTVNFILEFFLGTGSSFNFLGP
ncbi:MAG: hypothetical protein A2845_02960 [Candidatus Lloydbacteria bacterium RIFCSPHIGHO2_01_FULL_49_22]|uniref:Uncharacterized protein n=1 Tax=Candidatus Lloydbacteria bacterium RIFCSPHIGHO2_01_FULL_49_22 TaxID=1798658 RepID=A0A1G2CV06_9BACT|nr:MAG: hypothetical protein A2845_02960 [Candidatus Lloydbacteria bacterium RIFCSPHIGHO2_01_FULL_49_22]OGZ10401.1 MAG: hypothetical protein A3C14_02660 [Candidatus Lloydbacteria bacterium RIFCSPHIGHO2_02_FULL_50_18]